MRNSLTIKISKKETLEDLIWLHQKWKEGRETLSWWRDKTGYVGENIRKVCKIPITHPESALQIACIYYLQLIYTSRTFRNKIITQQKRDVYEFLKNYAIKYGVFSRNKGIFPW